MAYLLFLNVIMVTRLGYLTRETPASAGATWGMGAAQLLALGLFDPDGRVLLMAVVVLAVTALTQYLEGRHHHLAGTRSFAFLILTTAGAILLNKAILAPWSLTGLQGLAATTAWTAELHAARWQQINLVAFGLLVLTNEVNLIIRYGFHRLNLEPKVEASEQTDAPAATDITQYNAGRVIGILERYFILTVLLAGADYAAVAVVLAAKGFARFKQLDRREFAEYVLIGTLASTLSAVVVAAMIDI